MSKMAASTSMDAPGTGTSASGLEFKLHPLVLISISDHHTRVKAQQPDGSEPARVLGCLLGEQQGRTVEISNSFELKMEFDEEGGFTMDGPFLQQKQEQYKKTFPSLDVLGWYSTGSELQDIDMTIHKTISEINESPVYMLVNPAINPASKDLPITLYESELHVIDNTPSLIFARATYTIETVEAERISVDHVARILPTGTSSSASQLTAHMTGMHSAIKMLNSRVGFIHQLLIGIQKGEVPYEHDILRQVSSLVRCLPAMDSPDFQKDFMVEYNDTLLMAYMATITKGTSTINDLVEKFNMAYDKHSRRRTFM